MGEEDRQGRLEEAPFDYGVSKDGKVFITWGGKTVMILKGPPATRLLRQIEGADPHQVQLALAKATGNFKRGNERDSK